MTTTTTAAAAAAAATAATANTITLWKDNYYMALLIIPVLKR